MQSVIESQVARVPPLSDIIRLTGAVIGHDRPLMGPLDLDIKAGETIAVVGPNGGGKTTLIQSLCGALPLLAGQIDYPAGRRPITGYVPQRQNLSPLFPFRVLDVTALPLIAVKPWFRTLGNDDRAKAREALEKAGLGGNEKRLFRDLSGGQQQRVLLARALVLNPELVILDEPSAGLDPDGEQQMLDRVRRLAEARSVAVVIVSHDVPGVSSITRNGLLIDWKHGLFEKADLGDPAVVERLGRIYRREAAAPSASSPGASL